MFCPGCGIGTTMNCFYRAFSELELDLDKYVFVSGIGCSSRIPSYIFGDSLHTLHGRSIPYATGVKLANPNLKVVVFTGDGDAGAIGGAHFINGCRRNIDLTVICINNNIYGMTGGQTSITTPFGYYTTTAPYGNKDYPFSLAELAATSGANYVERWTTSHVTQLVKAMKGALSANGFSFVEVVSQCPVAFGRRNKMGDAQKMLAWFKQNTITIEEANAKRCETTGTFDAQMEFKDKIIVGKLVERKRKSFCEILGLIQPDHQEGGQ